MAKKKNKNEMLTRDGRAESNDEKRTKLVVFRVSEKEFARIEAHATQTRKGNVGWYCRDAALRRSIKNEPEIK